MGLLLIFMMSTPIFSILGKGSELTESFLDNFSEENREKELREFQNIQKVYLEKVTNWNWNRKSGKLWKKEA